MISFKNKSMKDYLLKILQDKNKMGGQLVILRKPKDERPGSDIDIMVPNNLQKKEVCYKFLNHISKDNWKIISYRELDYLLSIIIVNNSKLNEEAIKIDFFEKIGWLGLSKNNLKYDFSKKDIIESRAYLTVAQKFMYAGKFEEKDIERVKYHFNESLIFLQVTDLIRGNIYQNKKLSILLKWRIRFRISGYSAWEMPYWTIIVLFKSLRNKFKPYRSPVLSVFLNFSNGRSVHKIIENLINTYKKSGDSSLPKLSSLNVNISNAFQRKVLHLISTYVFKTHICFFINTMQSINSNKKHILESINIDGNNELKDINSKIINQLDKLIIQKNFKITN